MQILYFLKDDVKYSKIKKVFMRRSYHMEQTCFFWVNAKNDAGETVTFAVGKED